MKKPNILLVGTLPPPSGGMVTSMLNLLDSELKDKYNLIVLDITGRRTRQRASFLEGLIYQIGLIFKLLSLLMRYRPKIAHVHMATHLYFYRRSIDIIICRMFGAKVILHMHGARFIEFYQESIFPGKIFIKTILKMSNKVIALSEFWHNFLATITDAQRIEVIPNGARYSEFHLFKNRRKALGLTSEDIIVLFLSPICKRKGVFDILKAIPEVVKANPKVCFVFCGWEEYAGDIKDFSIWAEKNGLASRVKFVGPVSGQDKIDHYLSSDIFILPSYADNLPNALLEAMAAGLPAVASDVGAIPEIIRDGSNGFIIKAGDVEKMAKRITALANDPVMRKAMGDINLRLVKEKYDIALVAGKIDKLYREMLEGPIKKPRILLIGPLPPPNGGMATSLQNLMDSDLKNKYELIVLDITGKRTRQPASFVQGLIYQIGLIFQLASILIKKRPKIAHVQMTTHLYFYRRSIDIIICRLLGIRVILHLRGGRFIEFYKHNPPVGKLVIKFILKISNRVVALSEFWRNFLATIMDERRIDVIPNGVRNSDFHLSKDLRNEFCFTGEHVIVLFLSPLGKAKGAFDILEAVPKVIKSNPKVCFMFCGWEGSKGEMEEFESIVRKYNVETYVRCTGPVSGQDKIDHYLSSDIFILPSYADNLPNALLEAMAAGLPAVVSDVGAIPEIIRDGSNGFIIKAGDVEKMAKRITALANDPVMRKAMGDINLRLAKEKYDIALVAGKIDELYRKAIEE